MKKLLLLLLLTSNLHAEPLKYEDVRTAYGSDLSHSEQNATSFKWHGIQIKINIDRHGFITSITFNRDSAFSEFEVEDILGKLGTWKQNGSNYTTDGMSATWDNGGGLVITPN